MLPSGCIYGGWPKSGEIDIMEQIGIEPYTVHGTIHFGMEEHEYRGKSVDSIKAFSDDFHVFAIEREENQISWILDDAVYFSMNAQDIGDNLWPFNEDFYFLLNLAVGGEWPGYPEHGTIFPQRMLVDYIRVYDQLMPSLVGPRIIAFDGYEDVKEYRILNAYPQSIFEWSVPDGSEIVSGQGTDKVRIKFSDNGGKLTCLITKTSCKQRSISLDVIVKGHFFYNYSFFHGDDSSKCTIISHTGDFSIVQNPSQSSIELFKQVARYSRASGDLYDTLVCKTAAITNADEYVTFQRSFYIDVLTDAPVGKSPCSGRLYSKFSQ